VKGGRPGIGPTGRAGRSYSAAPTLEGAAGSSSALSRGQAPSWWRWRPPAWCSA